MEYKTLKKILAAEQEPQMKRSDLEDKLMDQVLSEIEKNIAIQDFTAIAELLEKLPVEYLIGFLPEEQHAQFEPLKEL
jgi:hypothetical protein